MPRVYQRMQRNVNTEKVVKVYLAAVLAAPPFFRFFAQGKTLTTEKKKKTYRILKEFR